MIRYETPHRGRLRAPEEITLAVIHYTGSMDLDGTLAWFQAPASKVSAHYVVGRDGEVHQFDEPLRRLWHAGRSEWDGRPHCNAYSIGIELVGTHTSGFLHAQYAACADVLAACMDQLPIRGIVGHQHVSPGRKRDPGPGFEWARLQVLLEARLGSPLGLELEWFAGQSLPPRPSPAAMEPGVDDEDEQDPAQPPPSAAIAHTPGRGAAGLLGRLLRALAAILGRTRG